MAAERLDGRAAGALTLDTIDVTGIRVYGRHGADAGERDLPQPFDVELSLDVDLSAPRSSDTLDETVDYASLTATVRSIVREHSYALLERLGDEIVTTIMRDGRIARASVRIAKPALLAGATPAVTVRRERAAQT